MAFTYDIATDRGRVRFLVGDTSSGDQLLQDSEVDYCLTLNANVQAAAAYAAESIAAAYSRLCDKSAGDLSISADQKSKQYLELAKKLRRSAVARALGWAGGTSISSKNTRESDTDRVAPAFTKDMLDNPGSASATST